MVTGHVNIVIPVFNQEGFIRQAVESALSQTYPNFDVSVVDDGSTDGSAKILEELLRAHAPRLKLTTQENQGLAAARNAGIRAGEGEFILPLDADDWIDPIYLEHTVPKMADTRVGIVSTDMQYEGLRHDRIPPLGLTLRREMFANDLPVCSLIRREAFEQTRGYQQISVTIEGKNVPGFEDWCLWIDLLKHGWGVGVVSQALFHYRLKSTSMITEASKVRSALLEKLHALHPELDWSAPPEPKRESKPGPVESHPVSELKPKLTAIGAGPQPPRIAPAVAVSQPVRPSNTVHAAPGAARPLPLHVIARGIHRVARQRARRGG
jgi:hypothetical protein